jgi:hypothetical protein
LVRSVGVAAVGNKPEKRLRPVKQDEASSRGIRVLFHCLCVLFCGGDQAKAQELSADSQDSIRRDALDVGH